jgi:large subunit ribosomal protein L17
MRHKVKTIKLGRSQSHRNALLANLVCSLIEHNRIRTTLAKAKATRPLAEKMVTFGKKGTIHARRMVFATLGNADAVKTLFEDVAPRCATRNGGYTRIIKLGPRKSDSAPMAFIEWVDAPAVVEEPAPAAPATKGKAKKAAPEAAEAPAAEKKPARKPRAKKADKADEGDAK